MIIYIILFIFLLFGIINHRSSRFIYFISIIIMLLLVTFRYGNGPDYFSYRDSYLGNNDIEIFEYGFQFLIILFRNLGLPFELFSFFLSFVNFVFLDKTLKLFTEKFSEKVFFLFGYFCLFFFTHQFNLVRNGLSIVISIYGYLILIKKNNKVGFFYFIFGFLFHSSTLFLIIPLFFNYLEKKSLSIKYFLILFLFIPFFFYYDSGSFLMDFLASKFYKIDYYINIYHLNFGETEIKNYGYTYGLIINSVLFLYLIFYIKINFELKYVLLSSLFLSFLLNNFGFLVERIYLFGNYTVLYMISIYVFNKKYKYNFYLKKLFFLLYFIFILFTVLSTKDLSGNLTYFNYVSIFNI